MQSTVIWIELNCARFITEGVAIWSWNVVTTPRPQNEKGGPVSELDYGCAGMLAVSLPVAAPTAKTSDRGRSDIVVMLPSVRRFMLHSPECVTQMFAL